MASNDQQPITEEDLFHAVLLKNPSYVQALVNICDGTFRQKNGNTLLHYYANAEITELLIENTQVNLDSQNEYGFTPLHRWFESMTFQSENGLITYNRIKSEEFECHYDIMKCLLESGADCNLQENKHGNTVLHDAIFMCMSSDINLREEQIISLVELLLSFRADPNIKNFVGRAPLHKAIDLKSPTVIRLLTQHGSNVNVQDNNGYTPLHFLAEGQYDDDYASEIAALLIENGADPSLQNNDGMTAFHMAVMKNNRKLVDLLLQPEHCNECDNHSLNVPEESMCNSLLHIVDKNGMSALHYAVGSNCIRTALVLLSNGATVNAVDRYGSSALHYAAYNSNREMIKSLKDLGGDPEIADNNGNTPAFLASRRNYFKTVAALQEETGQLPDNYVLLHKNPCEELYVQPIFNLTTNQLDHIQVDTWDDLFEKKFHGDSKKFLKDMTEVQGVGKLPNISEVTEIKQAIEICMDELTKCMSKIDNRFKGEISKIGSMYEGTKVGEPDEFNYMFILTEFQKDCSINLTGQTYDDVIIKKDPDKSNDEFDEFFEDNDLKCSKVMQEFVDISFKALSMVDYKSLPCNLYVLTLTKKTRRGLTDVQPGITACQIGFRWCGSFYKNLVITADLVPALRVKSWPKSPETESKLLTEDVIKQGCHVVQKSDKWRLSFSLAEQTIMNKLSDNLKSSYIEAKVARDPKITMQCVIFEEKIEDWENHLSGKSLIDGKKLIPSYLLKLVLFNCIEDCHRNGRDTSEITSAMIFSKLNKCLQENIPIPFFFMKKHSFLEELFNEDRPYEHVAFAVSIIDNFFKPRSNRNSSCCAVL